jgi:hypothetical protein
MENINQLLQPYIQDLICMMATNESKQLSAKTVLKTFLEIEQKLATAAAFARSQNPTPGLIMDGDEMVKYFNRKKPASAPPDTI